MPTDISHLPPALRWVIAPSSPLTDWRACLTAVRIGANPPASAAIIASRAATAAPFAARRRERHA